MFQRLFLSHPGAVGETYGEHRRVALSFAGPLFVAALACLVHAFIPGLFEKTASGIVQRLQLRMTGRGRLPPLASRPVADPTAVLSARH